MSPVAVTDAQLARLRHFILLDVATSLTAVVVMSLLNLVAIRNLWLLAATAMVLVAAVLIAMGLRPLARGDAEAGVMWVAVGNWAIAMSAAAIATFSWPVQQLAALLPVMVAAPYVSRNRFRVILLISIAVSVVAAALGLVQDFTGLTDDLADWVAPTILIMFTPFMSVLVALAGRSAAAALSDALDESLTAAELLRESRRRLVAAADSERRRIERDLHDGAQARLIGMSLQISLAREQCLTDTAAAQATLDAIRSEVRHAQDDMRALVRGLHPPVLTQRGLAPAIRAAIANTVNPYRDLVHDVGRHDAAVESAIYFCCLEALQNVAKHTPPETEVTVTLSLADSTLILVVADGGPGFVPVTRDGAGLVNMADRIGAAGGTFALDTRPGSGTRIEARVPARREAGRRDEAPLSANSRVSVEG